MSAELKFNEAVEIIRDDYVKKLFSFLRGDSQRVQSPTEFMKVYQIVMYQCDHEDNGEKLYKLFQQVVREYLEREALPEMKKHKEFGQVLTGFIKIWDKFALLAKSLDRMFDYLNRYYLTN